MNISVRKEIINLSGSSVIFGANDNLHDLFTQYGDGRLSVDRPEPTYYISANNDIFALIDALQKSIPSLGHDICWEWTGVRKGGEYYIRLNVTALTEEIDRFWKAFHNLCPDAQEVDTSFELPDIDYPIDYDDPEAYDEDEDCAECDEESRLRDIESLTIGNTSLQWKREPMEYGGGVGIITTIGVAAGVGSFGHAFIKDFVKTMMRNHYSRKIEHLQRMIVKACKGKGRIIPPVPEAPKVYNMERNEYEYEFTQLLNDGTKYRVFIGVESGKISFVPYQ